MNFSLIIETFHIMNEIFHNMNETFYNMNEAFQCINESFRNISFINKTSSEDKVIWGSELITFCICLFISMVIQIIIKKVSFWVSSHPQQKFHHLLILHPKYPKTSSE